MGIHPPLLYLGYVGMTVPFAYAVAALVTGNTGHGWVQVTRRWTLIAWTCLTAGILLGGWWSYEVLGWGGYWAWDPVENASIKRAARQRGRAVLQPHGRPTGADTAGLDGDRPLAAMSHGRSTGAGPAGGGPRGRRARHDRRPGSGGPVRRGPRGHVRPCRVRARHDHRAVHRGRPCCSRRPQGGVAARRRSRGRATPPAVWRVDRPPRCRAGRGCHRRLVRVRDRGRTGARGRPITAGW